MVRLINFFRGSDRNPNEKAKVLRPSASTTPEEASRNTRPRQYGRRHQGRRKDLSGLSRRPDVNPQLHTDTSRLAAVHRQWRWGRRCELPALRAKALWSAAPTRGVCVQEGSQRALPRHGGVKSGRQTHPLPHQAGPVDRVALRQDAGPTHLQMQPVTHALQLRRSLRASRGRHEVMITVA